MKPLIVTDEDLLMKWLFFSSEMGDSALLQFESFVVNELGLEATFCAQLRTQLDDLKRQFDNGVISVDVNGERVFDLCDLLWTRSDAVPESTSSSDTDSDEIKFVQDTNLDGYMEALYADRGFTRELVLDSIIEFFNKNNNIEDAFVENKSATLLQQCIRSILRGSPHEIALASHVIGLLALTAGPGDKACYMLEESVPHLTNALKSGSDTPVIPSLVKCLAILTFVAGEEVGETEKSMQTLWKTIQPEAAAKLPPSIIASVVSSWTFILTTLNRWTLNPKGWPGFVSYLSALLDNKDSYVCIAAGEALALIFEVRNLVKFFGESARESLEIQGLRTKVLNQVRALSTDAGGELSASKDLDSQVYTFRGILEVLEGGCIPVTSIKIGDEPLNPSNWAKLIQLNFIKDFLGRGFVKHMQDNAFLHDVFVFTPKNTEDRLSG